MITQTSSALPAESQTLFFAPLAWLKLQWFCHSGATEIGGFGISAKHNPLYVEDFVTVSQRVTSVSVAFDGAVVEGNAHRGDALTDRDEVLDIERIVLGRDAEAADLGRARVAEPLQLQPGQRGEEERLRLSRQRRRGLCYHRVPPYKGV